MKRESLAFNLEAQAAFNRLEDDAFEAPSCFTKRNHKLLEFHLEARAAFNRLEDDAFEAPSCFPKRNHKLLEFHLEARAAFTRLEFTQNIILLHGGRSGHPLQRLSDYLSDSNFNTNIEDISK